MKRCYCIVVALVSLTAVAWSQVKQGGTVTIAASNRGGTMVAAVGPDGTMNRAEGKWPRQKAVPENQSPGKPGAALVTSGKVQQRFSPGSRLPFNDMAVLHNDALDYLHLNYSSGTESNFRGMYDGLTDYSRNTGGDGLGFSYEQLARLKSEVTGVPSLLQVLERDYNAVTPIEKEEILNLYESLNASPSDAAIESLLQDFDRRIAGSAYSESEKSLLLGLSQSVLTVGNFWSSTPNFMQAPGETRTWQERAGIFRGDFSEAIRDSRNKPGGKERLSGAATTEDASGRKCRIRCVLCVVIQDVIALAVWTPILGPHVAAIAAAAWSAIARCCICGTCNAGCPND